MLSGGGPNNQTASLTMGEFIVQKDQVHLRLVSRTTIYEMQLQIGGSHPGLYDELKWESQKMRLVGNSHTEELKNNYQGSKIFEFVAIKGFLEDVNQEFISVAT